MPQRPRKKQDLYDEPLTSMIARLVLDVRDTPHVGAVGVRGCMGLKLRAHIRGMLWLPELRGFGI